MSDIIKRVEKFKRGWTGGLPETPCGFGSKISQTGAQRDWLLKKVKELNIKTITDVGAGDLNWISRINFPKSVQYTPLDLYPRKPEVAKFDIIQEVPPKSDLILCLWVLNHLEKEDALKAYANIEASGSKYLMMTYRPIWADEQPVEFNKKGLEEIVINENKKDVIKLIKL